MDHSSKRPQKSNPGKSIGGGLHDARAKKQTESEHSAPKISPEFVERYQIEFAKNPQSRIFAPLAEAYRQMGLLQEAHDICLKGVQYHPQFAGGRVAFARVLLERKEHEQALLQLEKAVQISPDNLLAQSLMGELLLEMRRPKEALKAFKMVLFLKPDDEKAQKAVRKWEFLSADDYDEELFKMRPLFATPAPMGDPLAASDRDQEESIPLAPLLDEHEQQSETHAWRTREIDRAMSLADAFTVRNDLEKALSVLKAARDEVGSSPELDRRLNLLLRRTQSDEQERSTPKNQPTESRRARLELFLRRINERRRRPAET